MVKMKIHFTKASNKQSVSEIYGLIRPYCIKVEKAYQEVQDYQPPTQYSVVQKAK